VLLITNWFPVIGRDGFPTGDNELLVDFGIDDRGNTVVLQNIPPTQYDGAHVDILSGEWCIK
jgi:hypothetical protein